MVELIEREQSPGGTPVIALSGSLGRFHIAQQGIHLRKPERLVGVDRATASEIAEQPIGRRLEMMRTPLGLQVAQYFAYQRRGVGMRQ
jgi:hypothetical protein